MPDSAAFIGPIQLNHRYPASGRSAKRHGCPAGECGLQAPQTGKPPSTGHWREPDSGGRTGTVRHFISLPVQQIALDQAALRSSSPAARAATRG